MPSGMASVQRPSGLIKSERSTSALKGSYLGWGREYSIEVNNDNWSKLLSDT